MATDFKKVLQQGRAPAGALSPQRGLSIGSTMLNLACTDNPHVGLLKGGYYFLVGDSASGKTWLSLTCFAEATMNEAFKNYRLIFDDVEGGALMDIAHYFGQEAAERMEPPAKAKNGAPKFSQTVQEFYYHINDILLEGRPFIYVLDSQDALDSDSAQDKFLKQKKAKEDDGEAAGSYGDGKAKYHSEHLRHVLAGLRKTNSILIIIGQTRDNLGFGFEKKTRSGGRALRFYANLELWSSVLQKITRPVRGKPRTIGVNVEVQVKKNRVTGKVGKDRAVTIPIYYDLGIDDIGSCVDFLIEEQHWRKVKKDGEEDDSEATTKSGKVKKKAIFDAKELLCTGTRYEIIKHIEDEGLEDKVRKLCGDVWKEIENESKVDRKKRYE